MVKWLLRIAGAILATNVTKSFVDNVFRDKVTPKEGSVVYCDLAFGVGSHSGIYVGNYEIVQLSSSGKVEAVGPRRFVEGKTAISIYVSCQDDEVVDSAQVAERARSEVGNRRDYSLLGRNCHQFCVGCLTGDFDSSNDLLWELKIEASYVLGSNTWRVWDLDPDALFG